MFELFNVFGVMRRNIKYEMNHGGGAVTRNAIKTLARGFSEEIKRIQEV